MTPIKRFFAFGCSYTNYAWPTWADIIGQPFKEQYYNYGRQGAGNLYIFNAIMQVDQIDKISKEDLVIVQWSSILREDRYMRHHWHTKGGIVHAYPQNFVEQFFDMRGSLIRDLALIKAVKEFLDKKGCQYIFISMCQIISSSAGLDDTEIEPCGRDSDVTDLYDDILKTIRPSFYDILGGYTNRPLHLRDNEYLHDGHKIPSEHYQYIKLVLPEFIPEDDSFVNEWDTRLKEFYTGPKTKTWFYPWDGIYKKDLKLHL